MWTQRAFSLVELLVVIGIISILAAILLPTLEKAQEQAVRMKCLGQLHQVNILCENYATEQKNFWPSSMRPINTTYSRIEAAVSGTSLSPYVPDPLLYESGLLILAGYATHEDVWCPDRHSTPGETLAGMQNLWRTRLYGSINAYHRVGYDFRVFGSVASRLFISPTRDPQLTALPLIWDDVSGRPNATTGIMTRYSHSDGYNMLLGSGVGRWASDPDWTALRVYDGDTNLYFGTMRGGFVTGFLQKQ